MLGYIDPLAHSLNKEIKATAAVAIADLVDPVACCNLPPTPRIGTALSSIRKMSL